MYFPKLLTRCVQNQFSYAKQLYKIIFLMTLMHGKVVVEWSVYLTSERDQVPLVVQIFGSSPRIMKT